MKHIYMFTVMMLLAGLLGGCADKQQVSIDYGYDRPAGLKSLSKDLDLLIPRVAEKATPESGERRAKRLAEAVGLDVGILQDVVARVVLRNGKSTSTMRFCGWGTIDTASRCTYPPAWSFIGTGKHTTAAFPKTRTSTFLAERRSLNGPRRP